MNENVSVNLPKSSFRFFLNNSTLVYLKVTVYSAKGQVVCFPLYKDMTLAVV